MNQHFQGQFEAEFKYRIQSKAHFLAQLQQLNPETRLLDNTEVDWFYDTPTHQLGQESKSVSIREMQPSGIMLWIVKGPEQDRCEAVNITDIERARSMLLTMGMVHTLTLTKTRSMYFVNEFHVTVDHLEGFGDFAEFAIMTDDETRLEYYKSKLKQLAAQCQLFDHDLEHQSYKQMISAL